MKNLILVVVLFSLTSIAACKKDCPITNAVCIETPPNNEACQAAFNRWFYNSNTQKCSQIFYSGCSQRGFATKTECEACKCR